MALGPFLFLDLQEDDRIYLFECAVTTLERKKYLEAPSQQVHGRRFIGVTVCAIRAVGSGGSRRLAWGAQYLRAVKTIVLSVGDVNKGIPASIYI